MSLDNLWDWFQESLWIPKSLVAQILYIKWCHAVNTVNPPTCGFNQSMTPVDTKGQQYGYLCALMSKEMWSIRFSISHTFYTVDSKETLSTWFSFGSEKPTTRNCPVLPSIRWGPCAAWQVHVKGADPERVLSLPCICHHLDSPNPREHWMHTSCFYFFFPSFIF